MTRETAMALTERQRAKMRAALESVMRAEDTVAAVAVERARSGETAADAALDRAADLLRELVQIIEPLTGG